MKTSNYRINTIWRMREFTHTMNSIITNIYLLNKEGKKPAKGFKNKIKKIKLKIKYRTTLFKTNMYVRWHLIEANRIKDEYNIKNKNEKAEAQAIKEFLIKGNYFLNIVWKGIKEVVEDE